MNELRHREELALEIEKPELTKTERLLAPGKNPTLTTAEKVLVRALVRKTAFAPSGNPDQVEITGLSEQSVKTLREMIEYEGDKLLFDTVVDNLNNQNRTDSHGIKDYLKDSELSIIKSGVMGNLDVVIQRVSENKGNCLEFSVVMQIIAKVFYPNEIDDVQIMGYSGKGIENSRHFFVFTKQKNQEKSPYSFTAYGQTGKKHVIERKTAEFRMEKALKKNEKDLANVYQNYIKLIDKSEQV